MNPKSTHKIIAGVGMAAVVGVAAIVFALHPSAPAVVAPIADAAPITAPSSDIAGATVPTPDASVPVPQSTSVATALGNNAPPAVVDTKPVVARHAAEPSVSGVTTAGTTARTRSNGTPNEKSQVETLAKNVDPRPVLSASGGVADAAPAAPMSIAPATSDSAITTAVKSEIAADNINKDVEIGVTTTLGVVVLTGSLASQEAIEHIKGVAEKVKDVKSVDVSALTIVSS